MSEAEWMRRFATAYPYRVTRSARSMAHAGRQCGDSPEVAADWAAEVTFREAFAGVAR